jgi:hypothetical protein
VVSEWDHRDTLLLIDVYRKHEPDFASNLFKKSQVWNDISDEINSTSKSSAIFTGTLCNKKWSNMLQRYKTKKDKMKPGVKGTTGRGKGEAWVYFDQMDELLGGSASVVSVLESMQQHSSKSSTKVTSTPVTIKPTSTSFQAGTKTHPNIPLSKNVSISTATIPSSSTTSAIIPSSSRSLFPMASTSTLSASVIEPPSESSDEEEQERQLLKPTPGKGQKRKRASGQASWDEKQMELMNEM